MGLLPPLPGSALSGASLPERWRAALACSACAVCERWQGEPVCALCRERFGTPLARCRSCAIELPGAAAEVCGHCLRHPPPYDAAITAWAYGYPWDHLIARFKFQGASELAGPLAQALGDAVESAARSGWLGWPELVLPVPLSPRRLRERGYNQAWELARRLALRWRLPAEAGWLERVRETPHQAELPRGERLHNLAAAFAVAPQARAELAGRRVALVDDVMTTGATLAEAALTLRRAGVAQVQVWVLARTPET